MEISNEQNHIGQPENRPRYQDIHPTNQKEIKQGKDSFPNLS